MPPELDIPRGSRAAANHRPASVTFRSQRGGEGEEAHLDPANQSLSEALSLIFKVLKFAMLALFAAFVLSGFQSIRENERGISLLFGRITGSDLESGFKFAAPFPLGEVVRVDTGNVTVNIDEAFWPRLTAEQRTLGIGAVVQQTSKPTLKPGDDGSLITGDLNIAHAKWLVTYTRSNPASYAQNIHPDDGSNRSEVRIVQAAAQRGIVQAVGQVSIDDLLKQSASESGSVAARAKEIAQRTLDEIDAGIRIDQFVLQERIPPIANYNDFAGVQSAEQRAAKMRDEAQTTARNVLNAMAGAAHEALIDRIDAYEQALARGDEAQQEQVLAQINGILAGNEVEVDGRKIPGKLVSGKVAMILNNAAQYRSSIVSQRQSELASFQAKLTQFKTNPNVVIQREWADAMAVFLSRPMVETFSVPAWAGLVDLWINRDIETIKQYQEAAKERKVKEAEEKRRLEQLQELYRTRTDAVEVKSD